MNELNISKSESDGVTRFDLTGDLVFGGGCNELRHALREEIRDGATDFVFNLGGVGYLDSCGIGELISALTAINRVDGSLVLLNPSDRISQLFNIAKLTTVFDIRSEGGAAGH